MKNAWRSLGAACVLVVGLYAYVAHSGFFESLGLNPADTYYNLLVRGFRAGQLSLRKDVPPGLARLADPYDPVANALYRSESYRMHDLSYYNGRLYLYFGVTPALILFWPYVVLTGHYLSHKQAVAIFCVIGFLASAGLLRALWRRYFAEVSPAVVVACVLALGLATGVPVLLARADVYEVPISCGYMLTMLALAAIWRALQEPARSGRWLAVASVAYGLAVGARPSLLLGAVILLVPVIQSKREKRPVWMPLLAAAGPVVFIGLGLMLYNVLRFDSPFEFGARYQLATTRQVARQFFGWHYLWFNFRAFFLAPAHWNTHFPFAHDIVVPPLPPGHGGVEKSFGILTNVPLVWLALAAPLAWRSRPTEAHAVLRGFLAAAAALFGICALTICFHDSANVRYEVEFLPTLLVLAVVGILGLERRLADRPGWRRAVRWGWGLLLGFSVAFNLLATVACYADADSNLGLALAKAGRMPEAIALYERALQLDPDCAPAHNNLGIALLRSGRVQEAIGHFAQAVQIKPAYAEAHNNLGAALARQGKVEEAIGQFEQALKIMPDYAEAHNNLGSALWQTGKMPEAIEHYEQALRIKPDFAEAQNNLARLRAVH